MGLLSPHRRFWMVLILLMTGCTLNNVGSAPVQTISGVPAVKMIAPQPNATYLDGVEVNIQATVSNAGKDIDRVEIVVDGQTIATLSAPNPTGAASFNVTHGWSASGAGSHSINVTAYRADGSSSTPAAVQITVVGQNGQTASATQAQGAATQQTSSIQTLPTQPQNQTAATQVNNPPTANATQPQAVPTTAATPSHPTATFAQGINVRSGPGLEFDPPIGAFAAGQSSQILAISMDGTWYKVQFAGNTGWVFASLTKASGDIATLPRDPGPPTPQPTAIPPTALPAATNAPATSANLVAGIVELQPGQPTCAQTFNIGLDVANLGSQPTSASSTVSVQDVRSSDGSVQQTTVGGFPVLQPNQTFRVNMPLTVSTYYNEQHTIILIIDPNNQIPETSEDDNRREVQYTLQRGSCP